MASVFFLTVSRVLLTYHRTNASKRFHERIMQRVLYFPIAFFDVTPIGRIINRFSQDMATVDEDLAQTMSQVISMFGSVLGSIGAIAGSTKGTFLILMLPLSVLYRIFNVYFRKSNTAIARLESVSRSPIYADFSQTLSGTTTIRAYNQNDRFVRNLENYANRNTIPGVLQQIASQWLSIRLDFLGAIIQLFMGVLTKTSASTNFIPAGFLALGLSYAIQMTSMLKMAVRVTATMEAQFNSVERIRHYALNIDVEDEVIEKKRSLETSSDNNTNTAKAGDIEMPAVVLSPADKTLITAPANWPNEGRVVFEDVKMRYRDGPLVLKGVSFAVNGCEKIGIAGRTGCGKSSLMVALFRIEELVEGRIIIDDIDISRLPLNTLRSKLCIIPQDPVMFSASVRFNLDPFKECTDEQVWEVLENVNMKEHILSLPNKLEELVAEGGDNFSAGQRQLICIGRAILRKPKILVMDEATASIDTETDNFIQRMIRTKFKDCTILTIAHRLHTIVDSTKILVMDAGFVGEFDTPEILMNKADGIFKGLWDRHVSEGGMTGVNLA
jgi:ATP-binding cassette, subfamily C (CFTR/MRP), member 1